jgi:16S rRNA (cytosine967-C5)-methyltransferase
MMSNTNVTIALWKQLAATSQVILGVRSGKSGTAAIEAVKADIRPGVQALAFHVWRNLGRAQALRALLAIKAPPASVDALLCVGLALVWQDANAPYDPHTLVNQTVEAAKQSKATKAQANFINACLRRFLRDRAALVSATDADPVAFWNHPLWWIKRLELEYPEHWKMILSAANVHAPMSLRVNVRLTDQAKYLAELEGTGISAHAAGMAAVVMKQPISVLRIPGFNEGAVSVQDIAAQIAAPLLLEGASLGAGTRILDACAAPGGKTGHLLELCNAEVTALEIEPGRAQRIGENIARLGLHANVLVADASRPQDWWDGQLFDAILLDAPCTASGIVRRHPDIRWLRRESDITQLAVIQKRMLRSLWPLLRPGGRLLYCTCSLFKAEGQDQTQTFLAHHTDAVLLPSPGHLLSGNTPKASVVLDNVNCDTDAFYYALFEKKMVY